MNVEVHKELVIITAMIPAPATAKKIVFPLILSYVMTKSSVERLPLYRQEKHFEWIEIFYQGNR